MDRRCALFDDNDAGQVRAGCQPRGDDIVAPIAPLAGADFDDCRAAALAEIDQAAGVQRGRGTACDMDDFDRLSDLDAGRRVEHETVAKERRVELRERAGESGVGDGRPHSFPPVDERRAERAEPCAARHVASRFG